MENKKIKVKARQAFLQTSVIKIIAPPWFIAIPTNQVI